MAGDAGWQKWESLRDIEDEKDLRRGHGFRPRAEMVRPDTERRPSSRVLVPSEETGRWILCLLSSEESHASITHTGYRFCSPPPPPLPRQVTFSPALPLGTRSQSLSHHHPLGRHVTGRTSRTISPLVLHVRVLDPLITFSHSMTSSLSSLSPLLLFQFLALFHCLSRFPPLA